MLLLEGVEYGLRPSWEAVQAIENKLGRGLVELGRDATMGRLTTGDAAVVIGELIRAWGRATEQKQVAAFKDTRIGELLFEAGPGFGYVGVMRAVGGVLSLAATGGYTAQGEMKAPAEMKMADGSTETPTSEAAAAGA